MDRFIISMDTVIFELEYIQTQIQKLGQNRYFTIIFQNWTCHNFQVTKWFLCVDKLHGRAMANIEREGPSGKSDTAVL